MAGHDRRAPHSPPRPVRRLRPLCPLQRGILSKRNMRLRSCNMRLRPCNTALSRRRMTLQDLSEPRMPHPDIHSRRALACLNIAHHLRAHAAIFRHLALGQARLLPHVMHRFGVPQVGFGYLDAAFSSQQPVVSASVSNSGQRVKRWCFFVTRSAGKARRAGCSRSICAARGARVCRRPLATCLAVGRMLARPGQRCRR